MERCRFFLLALAFSLPILSQANTPPFHSYEGREHIVTFEHAIETEMVSLDQVQRMSTASRDSYLRYTITPLMKFLFGPSTHRSIGGPQRNEKVTVSWDQAFLENSRVMVPMSYRGIWILNQSVSNHRSFQLPVPRQYNSLFTTLWKNCTDSDPDHQTASFYWYFWDPSRYGCDNKEGVQFTTETLQVGPETFNQTESYPEYDRLIRTDSEGNKKLSATIGFGYVYDPVRPNPETDGDAGIYEYQRFVTSVRSWLPGFKEVPILMGEYENAGQPETVIGHRFTGVLRGVEVTLNVVAAAGVDQMYLFAKSFAHEHDGLFAWMGHSRVGGGFDANRFSNIMNSNPNYYSVTKDYQIIYWGGCNSYSYYTLPFFSFKAERDSLADPYGTKNLDIIAHGLPSYFSLNGRNAATVLTPVLQWEKRTSYQYIIRQLERNGNSAGTRILAAVLGDEDNPK